MEKYFIDATEDSPSILFDGDKGLIEIKGRSLPENATACYTQLYQRVKEYAISPKGITTFNFRLGYLNSSSAKKILEVITLLEDLPVQGFKVDLNWYYNTEDEDMHEEGEEFKRMTDLPINLLKEQ
jgi:hypothetical protein